MLSICPLTNVNCANAQCSLRKEEHEEPRAKLLKVLRNLHSGLAGLSIGAVPSRFSSFTPPTVTYVQQQVLSYTNHRVIDALDAVVVIGVVLVAAGGDFVGTEVFADGAETNREKPSSTVGMYLAVDEDVRGIGCGDLGSGRNVRQAR